MSNTIARFLAWRYYRQATPSSLLTIMHRVCFLSIILTTFFLTLTRAIIVGFEKTIEERMQNIYPTLVMYAPEHETFDYAQLNTLLLNTYKNQITQTSPGHTKQIIIKMNNATPNVVTLKAIDPLKEPLVSSIEKKLENKKTIAESLANNTIIIGSKYAEQYNLTCHDTLTFLYAEDDQFSDETQLQSCTLTIGNIMNTGILQYDFSTILVSLDTMHSHLQDNSITLVGLQLNEKNNAEIVRKKLEDTFHINVYSWKTLYPALLSALSLQKKMSFLLMCFVAILSCVTIAALIFMHIQQKYYDIAFLKTIGMSQYSILSLFVIMNILITVPATLIGLLCAKIIGFYLQNNAFFSLSDDFLFSNIPVLFSPSLFFGIFASVLIITTSVAFLCALSTRSINCTTLLRFKE